jgi:hypothetical protein
VTPPVEIVVDELVVRGLPPHAAHVAAAALEARLTALAEQSPPKLVDRAEAFRRLPTVEAGSPAEVGNAVGDEVWSALS